MPTSHHLTSKAASLDLPSTQEALELRARLRQIGPPAFEIECLQTKKLDLRVVGTALGVPAELAEVDDEDYLGFFRGIMLYITPVSYTHL